MHRVAMSEAFARMRAGMHAADLVCIDLVCI
jgi:hypothetical protein